MNTQGSTAMAGTLQAKKLRSPKFYKARQFRTPWGRIAWTADPGEASLFSQQFLQSSLTATRFDGDGVLIGQYDLGSGVVTAVGALALANDYNLAAPSGAAINTLKLANNHCAGTGTTAAALTNLNLQTISANLTAGANTATAGTQTLQFTAAGRVDGTNYPKYQTVGTVAFNNTDTITEWGLFTSTNLLPSTTGISPWTAGSATTGTVTGTTLTASSATVQGSQQTVFLDTTNATPHWSLCISNTTSVVTVPAWFKTADATAAGVSPANTDTLVMRPVMLDHRIFAGIGVSSGDSIQFTYQLAIQDNG